jgi:hypothetical protein
MLPKGENEGSNIRLELDLKRVAHNLSHYINNSAGNVDLQTRTIEFNQDGINFRTIINPNEEAYSLIPEGLHNILFDIN